MSTRSHAFESVFSVIHDVAIVGGGYAALAAAQTAAAAGRSVLVIDRQAALAWESGWAMSGEVGSSDSAGWRAWMGSLEQRGAARAGMIDGALAEICAHEALRRCGARLLGYASVMAIERDGDLIRALIVGTKSGMRRVVARQWIDATEDGELLRLADPRWQPPGAVDRSIQLYFRHDQRPLPSTTVVACAALPGTDLVWTPTMWSDESMLRVRLPALGGDARSAWVAALAAVREALPEAMARAVLTHGSVLPFPRYRAAASHASPAANLAQAVPSLSATGCATIAERFRLGELAAAAIATARRAVPSASVFSEPIAEPAAEIERADVVVAGTGTGGGLAAIAAARASATVIAVEPLPFAGGIGAGGGIHWYYYGVKGGLQDEMDDRIRSVMPLFAPPGQIQGFHPDAKKYVLGEMLREAGVRVVSGATLVSVQASQRRVRSALASSPTGPRRLHAACWIDATGDGDLAASAGASHSFGRCGDGLFHAYSQSSGLAIAKVQAGGTVPYMRLVNFDAGFVDPTDCEDLTRARSDGILQYLRDRYTAEDRPTYIAPAIGLRQSRHIDCAYMLTLADLVEQRRFPDSVGTTGAHYDNHATDYEFESDEALFWVWVCRQWAAPISCEIPYRMIVPAALDNVWMACRAAGVTSDAHHSFRMQRDIQRIGEVAGEAAAIAVRLGCSAHGLPYAPLRERLDATGATASAAALPEDDFGPDSPGAEIRADDHGIARWIEDLASAGSSSAAWHLYRRRELAEPAVAASLASDDQRASFAAACIFAMWRDQRCEERLLSAVASHEDGFDGAAKRPENSNRVVPFWLIAISLLRRCGAARCLPVLRVVAETPGLVLNVRTALAITCRALAERLHLSDDERQHARGILDALALGPVRNASGVIQRHILDLPSFKPYGPRFVGSVAEDSTWQLDLCLVRARQALAGGDPARAAGYAADPRAVVRRAFAPRPELSAHQGR